MLEFTDKVLVMKVLRHEENEAWATGVDILLGQPPWTVGTSAGVIGGTRAGVTVGAGLGAAFAVFVEHRYVEKHW